MNEAYRRLISGESRGTGPVLARCGLQLLSWAYELGVRARNGAFDRGWKRIQHAPVPVVSLGNITTGGTGKTPLAAFVAHYYAKRGVRVAFVSRGYRAGKEEQNDEARVLAQLCPEVPHVQGPDRVRGAARAVAEFGSQLVILDDGLQHRRLARDLDIVLIDATQPWGYGHLLPRGLLREPLAALTRADLVLLTRADQVDPEQLDVLRGQVTRLNPRCGIADFVFPPERLVNAAGREERLECWRGSRVAAFCGIGNPAAFRTGLESLGYIVGDFRVFPDHHDYSEAELDEVARRADSISADAIVCTQKDLVKIKRELLGNCPLWAVAVGARAIRGEEVVNAKLMQVISSARISVALP